MLSFNLVFSTSCPPGKSITITDSCTWDTGNWSYDTLTIAANKIATLPNLANVSVQSLVIQNAAGKIIYQAGGKFHIGNAADNNPPAGVSISLPDSNVCQDPTPIISWSASSDDYPGLYSYWLQVADDSNFPSTSLKWNTSYDGVPPTIDASTTSYSDGPSLDRGKVYYARVQAFDRSLNNGGWSSTSSFTVGDASCDNVTKLECPDLGHRCENTCVYTDRDASQILCEDNSGCTAETWIASLGTVVGSNANCCGDDSNSDNFATYSGSLTTSTSVSCRRCSSGSDMGTTTLYGNGYTTGDKTSDTSLTCYYGDITCNYNSAQNGQSKVLYGNGYTTGDKNSDTSLRCYYEDIDCSDGSAKNGTDKVLYGNGYVTGTTCYYDNIDCSDGSAKNGTSCELQPYQYCGDSINCNNCPNNFLAEPGYLTCYSSCTDNTDDKCRSGYYCSSNTCIAKKNNGEQCTNDVQCSSGKCSPSANGNSYCTSSDAECAYTNGGDMQTNDLECYNNDIYKCISNNDIGVSIDCASVSSTETDSGDDPTNKGTLTDTLDSCSGTACNTNSHIDTCTDSTHLTEYYVNGASYKTHNYTCSDFEVAATGDTADDPETTGTCTGGTGASCSDGAFSTTTGASGTDTCVGTCGTGTNSCYFKEYYAVDSSDACSGKDTCTSKTYDADTNSNTCQTCMGVGYWSIGGEVAASACCGDDANEFKKVERGSKDSPSGYNDSITTCCSDSTDCTYNDVCTETNGVSSPAIPNKAYCLSGTWYGGDYSSDACTAIVGSGRWNIGGEVAASTCCGDDSNEYAISCVRDSNDPGSNICDASNDNLACCSSSTDCVYDNTCYSSGSYDDYDGDGYKEYCNDGTWSNAPNGKSCTVGRECQSLYCINGYCRADCSAYNKTADLCSYNSLVNYNSYGVCTSEGCDNTDETAFDDVYYRDDCSLVQTSVADNDSCDDNAKGGYVADGTCAYGSAKDNANANCIVGGTICQDSDGNLRDSCSYCGSSTMRKCQNPTGTYYSPNGICVYDNNACDTDEVCWNSSNYRSDCSKCYTSGSSQMTCDKSVGNSGYQVDGMCTYGGTCCSTDVAFSTNYYCGCSGHGGVQCDSSTSDGSYTQDGTCTVNGCDTSGHVCFDDTNYQASCSSCQKTQSDWDTCDSDATSGGDYSADGICTDTDACTTNGHMIYEDSSDSHKLKAGCSDDMKSDVADIDNCVSSLSGAAFSPNGICTATDECSTGTVYRVKGSGSQDLVQGCTNSGGEQCIKDVTGSEVNWTDAAKGVCISGSVCENGQVRNSCTYLSGTCGTYSAGCGSGTTYDNYRCYTGTLDPHDYVDNGICSSGNCVECTTTEDGKCDDNIDNDCDGYYDYQDPDCCPDVTSSGIKSFTVKNVTNVECFKVDTDGDVRLKGTLTLGAISSVPSGAFNITTASGTVVAYIDKHCNMKVAGSINDNQASISSGNNEFEIKRASDSKIVFKIDSNGNVYSLGQFGSSCGSMS